MGLTERSDAEAAERLRRVQAVTDAALSHLTLERLLDELLVRVRDLLDVDTAAVLLIDRTGQELVATAAKGIEEEVEYRVRIPVGGGFAGTVAAKRDVVIIDEVDSTKVLNPILVQAGIRSLLGVPLIEQGRLAGVLHVGSIRPRVFTPEDANLLRLVADRVALAVRARMDEGERLTAETLQRGLLPDRLPDLHDFDVAATYVPAKGRMIGGDWYDVFALPSGTIVVAIGDVAGRGIEAATAMARLRSAVRAYAFECERPDQVLSRANNLLMYFEPTEMATLLVAFIAPDGEGLVSNAGHVPPLLVRADGHASFFESSPQLCLGGVYGMPYDTTRMHLEPGTRMLLYTDGLVERPGRSLDVGLQRLQLAAAGGTWTSLDELTHRVHGDEPVEDDVAILAVGYRPRTEPGSLAVTLHARLQELSRLRRRIRAWLGATGASPQQIQDVLVATSEAAANAIEHAYGPGRGRVTVTGSFESPHVIVRVADEGRWRPERPSDRGRGLTLIRGLMDQVDVRTDEGGTTVEMRMQIGERP